jgi:response regulator RpfG family c-di-GMP phosphodiesterase
VDNREKALDEFFRKNDSGKKKRSQKPGKPDNEARMDEYMASVTPVKPPKKQTFWHKFIDFFKITSFKSHFDEQKLAENQRAADYEGKSKFAVFLSKLKLFFVNRFSFEAGVDILDETQVLFRKNLVIRNILWLTNIVFILFTLIGSEGVNLKVNLIVTFAISLIMLFTSQSIRKIIYQEPKTLHRQQLGEYIAAIYILLMATTVYIKLKLTLGADPAEGFFSITQAGYALIYFAMVVLALYQDSKLLSVIFKATIVVMTIIHVTVLYPVYQHATDIPTLWNYLKGPILTDLVLRTMVLAIFMLALYSTARITEDMNNKRKMELIKRRSMEKDFKEVVTDVFDVISVYKQHADEFQEKMQQNAGRRVAEMAAKLGNFLGYSPKLCKEIFDFSTIHIDKRDFLSLEDYQDKDVLDEADFRKIREKTIVGSVIIKRLQLEKKGEDIVRAHFEKTVDKEFVKEMNLIQNNRESQVILLTQIYDILRQPRNYKRELKHARAIDLIQLEFYPYFDPQIVDRFAKYGDEFEAIYYRLSQE